MKNLKDYIIEGHSFLVNKKLNNRQSKYEYFPKDKEELENLIANLLDNNITDLNSIDVSNITNMNWLFYDIKGLLTNGHKICEIDISEWDVSNVTSMNHMFFNCREFEADLSKWDVSNVEKMSDTFTYCKNFNSDLSKWNVSKVKSMYGMFDGCESFNFDLSNWDVSGVADMRRAFADCKKLIENNKIPDWYDKTLGR